MFKSKSALNVDSGLIQRHTSEKYESSTSFQHVETSIHPSANPSCSPLPSSVLPPFFSSGHCSYPLIHQSVFFPPWSCLFFSLSLAPQSRSLLWPLVYLSALSLFFLFYLHLFSINQSSPCGLVLRLHYALPPCSHIYFIASGLWRKQGPRWQMKGWISTCIILTLSRRRAHHGPRRPAAPNSTQAQAASTHMDTYKFTEQCAGICTL